MQAIKLPHVYIVRIYSEKVTKKLQLLQRNYQFNLFSTSFDSNYGLFSGTQTVHLFLYGSPIPHSVEIYFRNDVANFDASLFGSTVWLYLCYIDPVHALEIKLTGHTVRNVRYRNAQQCTAHLTVSDKIFGNLSHDIDGYRE